MIRTINTRFFFGLSGTPIEKSLEDLYGILRALRCPSLESPLAFYASHIVCDDFGKVAFTHHPEFFFIRYSDRILRRLKSEVESSLPELKVEEVDLELTPLQEEMAAPLLQELDVLTERLKQRYDLNEFIRHRWLINKLVELSNSTALLARDTASSSKLEWLSRYLRERCIEEHDKVVVFTRWTRSQKLICDVCTMLGIPFESLSGQDSSQRREHAIASFSSDERIRAFISTDAGGIGVNLQAARHIVNFEPAWNPSTNAQRIQRVHRIGQTRQVTAVHLLTRLDYMFVLATHGRKSFAADRIDVVREASGQFSPPSWEELLPIVRCFQLLARTGVKDTDSKSR